MAEDHARTAQPEEPEDVASRGPADYAIATLRSLSQENMLMRHALALFANHQRAPYEHLLCEVEAARTPSDPKRTP